MIDDFGHQWFLRFSYRFRYIWGSRRFIDLYFQHFFSLLLCKGIRRFINIFCLDSFFPPHIFWRTMLRRGRRKRIEVWIWSSVRVSWNIRETVFSNSVFRFTVTHVITFYSKPICIENLYAVVDRQIKKI